MTISDLYIYNMYIYVRIYFIHILQKLQSYSKHISESSAHLNYYFLSL